MSAERSKGIISNREWWQKISIIVYLYIILTCDVFLIGFWSTFPLKEEMTVSADDIFLTERQIKRPNGMRRRADNFHASSNETVLVLIMQEIANWISDYNGKKSSWASIISWCNNTHLAIFKIFVIPHIIQ